MENRTRHGIDKGSIQRLGEPGPTPEAVDPGEERGCSECTRRSAVPVCPRSSIAAQLLSESLLSGSYSDP
ncbi:hypothetical protein TELCIR_04549 [Teladorsagia circumcincta]|uniref:Uncharacterized protein n=1 Tax=Teladorsagia circumcincta TaxID=45464 RepID=A0A2G9UUU4_TELCI|nr:hypothetical protein TELCIR_04549 [Teladorsagia circumcincta]